MTENTTCTASHCARPATHWAHTPDHYAAGHPVCDHHATHLAAGVIATPIVRAEPPDHLTAELDYWRARLAALDNLERIAELDPDEIRPDLYSTPTVRAPLTPAETAARQKIAAELAAEMTPAAEPTGAIECVTCHRQIDDLTARLNHAREWITRTSRRIEQAADDSLVVNLDADDARALAAALEHYAMQLELGR